MSTATTTIVSELQELYQKRVRDNNVRAKNANKKANYYFKGVESIGAKRCIEDFVKINQIKGFVKQKKMANNSDGMMSYMLGYFYQGESLKNVYAKYEVKGYNDMLEQLVEKFSGMKYPKKRTRAEALKVK